MMNKDLFSTVPPSHLPPPDVLNAAGGEAYATSARHALAQYASTGCLSATYYASAGLQLETVLALADQVPPAYVARVAIWSRTRGRLKDLPALLMAYLTVADAALAERVFPRVIDDAKMLRNFVQVVRSGAVARRSLGSLPKRLVKGWLARRTPEQLFKGSVGSSPSLGDVIKLAHPKPADAERTALYGYLTGRSHDAAALPELVQAYEAWKAKPAGEPPAVPFPMLSGLELGRAEWAAVARNASWTEARMNLNTFARHKVFLSKLAVEAMARKLKDREAIARSRVLPYQIMMAWMALDPAVPPVLRDALETAMEVALENVPRIDGKVYLCPDVSGSMSQPITGDRGGSTTQVRCVDVAGLMAAAMLRVNDAEVLPFEHRVVNVPLSRRGSVMTNARALAAVGGGGTRCSAPLAQLNAQHARGDLVVLVSDNESWADSGRTATALMEEWETFRRRNPRAKLVCIDLVPNRTSPAKDRADILDVGGFSDAVFEVVGDFAAGRAGAHWVEKVEAIEL